MDHLKKAEAELDKFANSLPEFKAQCEKNNVPPGMALGGLLGLSSLLLLWFQGMAIVSALVTCVFPMI